MLLKRLSQKIIMQTRIVKQVDDMKHGLEASQADWEVCQKGNDRQLIWKGVVNLSKIPMNECNIVLGMKFTRQYNMVVMSHSNVICIIEGFMHHSYPRQAKVLRNSSKFNTTRAKTSYTRKKQFIPLYQEAYIKINL